MEHGAHAAKGALAGTMLSTGAAAAGTDLHPLVFPAFALLVAGVALSNDVDCDTSTFTLSGGWATRILAEILQWLARITYRASRRGCDANPTKEDPGVGEHRGLLHTAWFPIVIGAVLGWTSTLTPWVGWIATAMFFAPAIRSLNISTHRVLRLRTPVGLNKPPQALAAAIVLTILLASAGVQVSGWLFGAAVTLGMWVHNLGDSSTPYGTPVLGGIVATRCRKHHHRKTHARCSRWRTYRLPQRWIVRTGHPREQRIILVSITASVCLAGAGALGVF